MSKLLVSKTMVSVIRAEGNCPQTKISLVSLPANFHIWLASREAQFLKGEFLWTNRDVDELKANAEEIETSGLLSIWLGG